MKKTAILLAVCMLVSIIPAVHVSAADDYYLKGIGEGEYVMANIERSRTLTLVNAADKNKLPSSASGVDKVVFTYNGVETTDDEAPFEYDMVFSSCGEQSLTYEVFTAGNGTPISKTVSFVTVAGVQNENSYEENFDELADVTKFYYAISGAGVEKYILDGKFVFQRAATSGMKQFAFKNAAVNAGTAGVQYYEFDVSRDAGNFECILRSAWASGSSDRILDTSVKGDNLAVNTTYKIGILLDFNSMTAIVSCDGRELKRVELAGFWAAEGTLPFLHITTSTNQSIVFDNFKFLVYDLKEPQEFSGASIAGGNDNPVLKSLSEIRIYGSDFLEDQEVSEAVSIVPYADITASIEDGELVVAFGEELEEGTAYTLTVDGVKDADLLAYAPYTLTFRTLNVGENMPPDVRVISPQSNARFYPGDIITLSAEASDGNGSISYVEFYKNDALIKGSRVYTGTDGVYTYEWRTDEADDGLEPVSVTALASDNEGAKTTSVAVNIKIQSKMFPAVKITSPAENTVYYSNFGGVKTDIKPTLKFEAEDLDGEIENIEVYVDGERVYSAADKSVRTYTLENALEFGEHRITVEVTDNDGQMSSDEISFSVEGLGKAGYILCEDMAKDDFLSKWDKEGAGTAKNGSLSGFEDVKGIIITTDKPETAAQYTLTRVCPYSLENTSFGADIKLAFSDTASERKLMLDTKELITFAAGGKFTYSGIETGAYLAGEIYNISAVVDAENLKLYILLDGALIGSASISNKDFTTREPLKIIHKGAAGALSETAVIYASVSKLDKAVTEPIVKLLDAKGGEIAWQEAPNGSNINYITVNFDGGTDSVALADNVKLIDNTTGKRVSLSYSDGKFKVCERLKYNTSYKIVVLPDARNTRGNGYSGAYETEFTTAEPKDTVGVRYIEAVVNPSDEGSFNATLKISFNGRCEDGKTVTLVCAAYKGSKMTYCESKEIYVDASANAATMDVALDEADEDTVIEAFAVDDMDNLNPISDRIFIIK